MKDMDYMIILICVALVAALAILFVTGSDSALQEIVAVVLAIVAAVYGISRRKSN